jgi:hypothetical protein
MHNRKILGCEYFMGNSLRNRHWWWRFFLLSHFQSCSCDGLWWFGWYFDYDYTLDSYRLSPSLHHPDWLWGPTQPPVQWVPGAPSLGSKSAGAWSWSLPSPSAKVKNVWNYASVTPYIILVWCTGTTLLSPLALECVPVVALIPFSSRSKWFVKV